MQDSDSVGGKTQNKTASSVGNCDTSLSLLMDRSSSISAADWQNQVEATASALTSTEVVNAIRSNGGVAVMAQEFTTSASTMVPWQVIGTREDAERFAGRLRASGLKMGPSGNTEIGVAVTSAVRHFATTPCKGGAKTIDLSTDGISNLDKMEAARAIAEHEAVRVNGIAVGNPSAAETLKKHGVTSDGFVVEADWGNYPQVLKRKIVLELSDNTQPGR